MCLGSSSFGQVVTLSDTVSIKQLVVESDIRKPSEGFLRTQIDSTLLNQLASKSVTELLESSSPIFIKKYSPGGLATVSFRGTGASHTKIYWNGMELNSPTLGQVDLSILPLVFVDEAEVHHGNASMMDGFGGLGGSVSLTSNAPILEGLHGEVQLGIGSFQEYYQHIKLDINKKDWSSRTAFFNKQVENNFSFRNISKENAPTETQQNALYKQHGFGQFLTKQIKQGEISFKSIYLKSNRGIPAIMTASIASEQEQEDQVFLGQITYKKIKLRHVFDFRSGVVINTMRYQDKRSSINSLNDAHAIRNQWRHQFYISDKFTLLNQWFWDIEFAQSNGMKKQETRPQVAWLLGVKYNDSKRLTWQIYNRPEIVKDRLLLFIPSVSLSYQVLQEQKLTVKANAGRNFKQPSLNDLYWFPGGDPDLKPEDGWSGEVGIQSTIKKKKFKVSLSTTVFTGLIDNWIVWSPADNGIWWAQNINQVFNRGVESQFTSTISMGKFKHQLNLIHSFTKSTIEKEYGQQLNLINKQLIYVPEHKFTTRYTIRYKHLFLNLKYEYVDSRFIDRQNVIYLPAYDLVGADINYNVKLKNVRTRLTLSSHNILNKEYMSLSWRAMPGRSYNFTVSCMF